MFNSLLVDIVSYWTPYVNCNMELLSDVEKISLFFLEVLTAIPFDLLIESRAYQAYQVSSTIPEYQNHLATFQREMFSLAACHFAKPNS